MIGGGFQHDVCSSALNKNKYVEWVKDGSGSVSIYIDDAINGELNPYVIHRYGWFAESSSIIPHVINGVLENLSFHKHRFKYIFTHDKRIIDIDPTFFKYTPPNACPWIQNKQIYQKSKLASIIVSNKTQTEGHRFRLDVLNNIKDKVDHYGRGFPNELPWTINVDGQEESGKLLALKDYYFSFAFENDNYPSIYCEKLTDCFATGTIPIFWGTPDIGDHFDIDGILVFDKRFFKIEQLTEELYKEKLPHVQNNFNKCMDILTSEDYIYLNYIK